MLAAALRIGAVADFLSKPVLTGYMSGAALILVSTQLGKLFGLSLESREFFPILWELAGRLRETHGLTLAIGVVPFTILTTEPNDLARVVHDRMPVILDPEDYARWLDPDRVPAELRPLLRPFPAAAMTAYPVSPRVNSPANDDPACLDPAEEPPSGPQLRLLM